MKFPPVRHPSSERPRIVVVGNGMVGHHFAAELMATDADVHLTVIGEEPRPAYDRVALTSWFNGRTVDELSLVPPGFYDQHAVDVVFGDPVTAINRNLQLLTTETGHTVPYDHLVLATGSYPFVPPIDGADAPGAFVYRTIEDLEAIAAWAREGHVRTGAVIGGGLLGLEAAGALMSLGLDTHVVEFAPRLMPAQLDDGGAAALQARVEDLGVTVHVDHAASSVSTAADGRVTGLTFATSAPLDCQLVVFSAGIRPRDELARSAEIEVGERGGIVVDDMLTTSDPAISAIGEVACHRGRVYGLVAPGYAMARTLAARIAGDLTATFERADMSTKLKLLGVDVSSLGDVHASGDDIACIVSADEVGHVYRKLVVRRADNTIVGAVLVGDLSLHARLASIIAGDLASPDDPASLLAPGNDAGAGGSAADLPDTAGLCSCNGVTCGAVREAIGDGQQTVGDLKACTSAGTGCGGCVPLLTDVMRAELDRLGLTVDRSLCEHFAMSRQDLYAVIRLKGYRSFSDTLAGHGIAGSGDGCDVCKPTVASILASLAQGYILDGEQATLQDTNDHFLANLQRDGTYSVVPRVPGGEITPEKLIVLGEVARDFGLYTKITGGQRVDLFGARVDQLPLIWRRLVDAGFESGHAYGKAMRTVKSCVGEVWCRYGVQDSTAMAIRLELRYRGLRSPHKIKLAVSGCARECAEAQSKDVGVIATDMGWNLYVGGNGGLRPRHADLLAEHLDDEALVQAVDRFLAFYIRTADRLERTATWLTKLDGGLAHLRAVVLDDALGIGAELEADIATNVDAYECEWKATIDDPVRMQRFVEVVHPDAGDLNIEQPVSITSKWTSVVDEAALTAGRGIAAAVGDQRVAIFRLPDGTVHAVGDNDPFTGADVISRGLTGSVGGRAFVASPMLKHRFDLQTGESFADPTIALPVFATRVRDGRIEVERAAPSTRAMADISSGS